jgi:hypothetical protein
MDRGQNCRTPSSVRLEEDKEVLMRRVEQVREERIFSSENKSELQQERVRREKWGRRTEEKNIAWPVS